MHIWFFGVYKCWISREVLKEFEQHVFSLVSYHAFPRAVQNRQQLNIHGHVTLKWLSFCQSRITQPHVKPALKFLSGNSQKFLSGNSQVSLTSTFAKMTFVSKLWFAIMFVLIVLKLVGDNSKATNLKLRCENNQYLLTLYSGLSHV